MTGIVYLIAVGILAQTVPAPSNLLPPEGEVESLRLHGEGVQVYNCKDSESGPAWSLVAPEAKLVDAKGDAAGRHFAGPTWEAADGSRVVGKRLASANSPDADAIPWLLLTAASHEGSGVLSAATSIQRLATKGGKAPAGGCDAAHAGVEARIAYSADYVFFSKQ